MHIYIITNEVNGKQYVGQTILLEPEQRIEQHLSARYQKDHHCSLIRQAVRKYGRNNFTYDIVSYPGASQEALDAIEIWKIKQLNTLSPNGYNIVEGGSGGGSGPNSKQTRDKISEIQKEKVKNGTHHWLGGEIQRKTTLKCIDKDRHNFLGPETNRKRVKEGTHNFLGSKNNRKRYEDWNDEKESQRIKKMNDTKQSNRIKREQEREEELYGDKSLFDLMDEN